MTSDLQKELEDLLPKFSHHHGFKASEVVTFDPFSEDGLTTIKFAVYRATSLNGLAALIRRDSIYASGGDAILWRRTVKTETFGGDTIYQVRLGMTSKDVAECASTIAAAKAKLYGSVLVAGHAHS